jgi:hypothetical protein
MSQVAEIILQQLGRGTLAMLGAHTFVSSDDSLTLRIKGCPKINCIKIVLDASDTYSMTFYKVGGKRLLVTVATETMVYADCLHRTIETHTKLATRL